MVHVSLLFRKQMYCASSIDRRVCVCGGGGGGGVGGGGGGSWLQFLKDP